MVPFYYLQIIRFPYNSVFIGSFVQFGKINLKSSLVILIRLFVGYLPFSNRYFTLLFCSVYLFYYKYRENKLYAWLILEVTHSIAWNGFSCITQRALVCIVTTLCITQRALVCIITTLCITQRALDCIITTLCAVSVINDVLPMQYNLPRMFQSLSFLKQFLRNVI